MQEPEMVTRTARPQSLSCLLVVALVGGAGACKFPPPLDVPDELDDAGAADADVDGPVGPTFVRSYSAPSVEFGVFVAADDDGIVFGGVTNDGIEVASGAVVRPFFAAKVDGNGRHVWSRSFQDSPNDAVIDRFGNAYIVGGTSGPLNVGGGTITPTDRDMFIAKYDPSGNHLWSRAFGGTSSQEGWRIAVMPDDDIVVCGDYYGSAALGGASLGGHGLNNTDVFVSKLSRSDGAHRWSIGFGSAGGEQCRGLVATATGQLAVFGSYDGEFSVGGRVHPSAGSTDLFAVGLTMAGSVAWSERFGGVGFDELASASVSTSGDALIAGNFAEDFMMGSFLLDNEARGDGLVARISTATGSVAWAKTVSGARDESVGGATAMGNQVIIAGTINGPARVGAWPLTPSAQWSVFTARLRFADGEAISAQAFDGWATSIRSTVTQGTVVLTGGNGEAIDFGVGLAQHGPDLDLDVFLARIIP
jgi:hypothetical protein